MGFWGKLGKGLLKVGKVAAPIALGMTGVGIPAAMAASAGLNALDKKTSGGSWKDALKSGAMGAATGAMGGGAGGGLMGRIAGNLGSKAVGTGAVQGLGNMASVGGGLGPSAGRFANIMGNIGQGARTAQDVAGAIGAMRGAFGGGGYGPYGTPPFNPNARMPRGGAMPRGGGFFGGDLAGALSRGRQEGLAYRAPWMTPGINPNAPMPNIAMRQGIGPRMGLPGALPRRRMPQQEEAY